MRTTVFILLFTLFVVPISSYYFSDPLNAEQWQILKDVLPWLVGVIVVTFILGELTKNHSQVDKIWSIIPIFYVWKMTVQAGLPARMVLMSILVTIWGIRLTYNFARRGAYQWKFWEGEEDYRWEVLRNKPAFKNRWVWTLFNFFFICFYQNILIFLFCSPIITCLHSHAPVLGSVDWISGGFMLLLIAIEYIADEQQYQFQSEKHRRILVNEPIGDYDHGFVNRAYGNMYDTQIMPANKPYGSFFIYSVFGIQVNGSTLLWRVLYC